MKIIKSRHVNQLEPIIYFYCELIGFSVIEAYKDRFNYDGVIIGEDDSDWTMEFTVSNEKPNRVIEEDDLMIIFIEDSARYNQIIEKLRNEKTLEFAPKNPHWEEKGRLFRDPEGYGVLLVRQTC